MKVTFTGVPGERHESVRMYGQDFPLNQAVDVTDPTAMRKLARHPHFKAEKTDEDRKIDEQVRREYSASAQAGLMEAEARAIRGQQAPAAAPAPAPAPVESGLRPLKSATEYQQVVEGAGVGTDLRTALQPEQNTEEASDGNAGTARNPNPSKAEGGRAQADAQRGRTGKGS